ncbi:MAG: hypothetical protein OXI17_06830 [Gammaproteobacteria bacterium]|nr:hypothetical protein [Gammaproteobacteria bacterium]
MQSEEFIDPDELIRQDEHFIWLNAPNIVPASGGAGGAFPIPKPAAPFSQSNRAGDLRPVSSIEKACIEGQRAALTLKELL